MVTINLEKRTLFLWGAVFLVLAGLVGVYAFGAVPNPGHAVSQLQTCDSDGQILKMSGGDWVCASDVSGGSGYWTLSGSTLYTSASGERIVSVRSNDNYPPKNAVVEVRSGTSPIYQAVLRTNIVNSRIDIGALTNTPLSFLVNGIERMRINTDGSVDVNGDLDVDGVVTSLPMGGVFSNGYIRCSGGVSAWSSGSDTGFTCDEPKIQMMKYNDYIYYSRYSFLRSNDDIAFAICTALGGYYGTLNSYTTESISGGAYEVSKLTMPLGGAPYWEEEDTYSHTVITSINCESFASREKYF